MALLIRFGMAMESELLARFDDLVERRGNATRSDVLRDLVRRELSQDAWVCGRTMIVTITLVYDHHVRELTERLIEIQHQSCELIVSTLHIHVEPHHCLDVIAAQGSASDIKRMADLLIGTKGVLTGQVVPAALPPAENPWKAKPRSTA